MSDYSELLRLAQAAKEAGWNWTGNTLWITDHDPSDPTGETPMQRPVGGADEPWLSYFEAVSPDVVERVVRDLREALAHNEVLRADLAAANARAEAADKTTAKAIESYDRANDRVHSEKAEGDRLRAENRRMADGIRELADGAVYADFGQVHVNDAPDEDVALAVRESDLRTLLVSAAPTDGTEHSIAINRDGFCCEGCDWTSKASVEMAEVNKSFAEAHGAKPHYHAVPGWERQWSDPCFCPAAPTEDGEDA